MPIPVPAVVSEDTYYAVQAQLAARDPRMGAAAVKTNTNLLTGHVQCGCDGEGCGGGMTTSTGKSGRYRYYACHRRASAGSVQCAGRRIRMETLDDIVVEAVSEQVLAPDRLHVLLQSWLDRSDAARNERQSELSRLRAKLTNLEGERSNVIKLVREGLCTADDPQIAAELGNIAAQKAALVADVGLVERQLADGERAITYEVVEKFGRLLASKLRSEDPQLRREYVRLLVDRVEVGNDKIHITGKKHALASLVSGTSPNLVPKAERKWCARQDSNLWPPD